jgi:hypothetical protein
LYCMAGGVALRPCLGDGEVERATEYTSFALTAIWQLTSHRVQFTNNIVVGFSFSFRP